VTVEGAELHLRRKAGLMRGKGREIKTAGFSDGPQPQGFNLRLFMSP